MKLRGLLFLLVVAPGCFATGVYRTARTVPKGEGDFTMGFNVVRLTMENPLRDTAAGQPTGGDTLTFTYPNLIPELAYHYGVVDNVEIGGRLVLSAGLIEMDAKYRFLGDDSSTTHVALAPSIGYHALGLAEGVQATLPLIFTHDLTDSISLNLGAFGSFSHYGTTNKTSSSSSTSTSTSSSSS